MTERYLALIGARAACDEPLVRLESAGFVRVLEREDFFVLAETGLPHLAVGEGIVLGRLHVRGEAGCRTELDQAKQEASLAKRGAFLTETCWGDYVALLPDPVTPDWHVVRAPFGALPALRVAHAGCVFVASDMAVLRQAGLPAATVDWSELGRHLLQPELRHAETCLLGVLEVQGGFRLTIAPDGEHLTELWSPWTFAARPRLPREDAAARVRHVVEWSVRASTARFGQSLLLLSGGLDSSIVAACLKRAERAFDCLTFRTAGAGGDERDYAQAVTRALDVTWHEGLPDPARVAIDVSAAGSLPRPSERAFFQDYDRVACALANTLGAEAILDGGGGDNLFYGYPSAAPVADALIEGEGRFAASARALADLTGSSVLRVMLFAARRAWRGTGREAPSRGRADLLTTKIRTDNKSRPLHPWHVPPGGMLPGRASHVALLAPAQALAESSNPLRAIPNVSVMLTQPVVETCLAVPTDLWFAPGTNRALARHAFADLLPSTVLTRRSKGTPDSFVASIYALRRAEIAALLADGLLVQNGLVEQRALNAVLADLGPIRGYAYARVLELLDAEVWARHWA